MQHQLQSAIASDPNRCADSSRAEILRAQVCANRDLSFLMEAQRGLYGAMVDRSRFKELWAPSRSIACFPGYHDVNEGHGAVSAIERPIIVDGDSGFGNLDNARSPGTRTYNSNSFDANRRCSEVTRIELRKRQAIVSGILSDIISASPARRLIAMAKIVASVNAAGSLLVAPLARVRKWLSTALYFVGIPSQAEALIMLDFAGSIMTEGKCPAASSSRELPLGAQHDLDGSLSEDPHILYRPYVPDGPRDHVKTTETICALRGHKGSGGLALICKLLGGALTGIGATALNRRFAEAMLTSYVALKMVGPAHYFDHEIFPYTDFIRAAKAVAGVKQVLMSTIPNETRALNARRTTPPCMAIAGRRWSTPRATRASPNNHEARRPTGRPA